METTFEFNLKLAIAETQMKICINKLFKEGDKSDASTDVKGGKPETLFSIALMYAEFVNDDFNNTCDAIFNALQEKFPKFV